MIYFDNAATTPVWPEVAQTVQHVLTEKWGNPSSLHHKGVEAEKIRETARRDLAVGMGVLPREIFFTSGATEGINTAISGVLRRRLERRTEEAVNVVASPVEHSAVYQTLQHWARRGVEIRWMPVDAFGRVNPESIRPLLDDDTALVTLMHVNNELGTIEPIEQTGALIRSVAPRAVFFVDGVQGFAKIPLPLHRAQVDLYAVSGHKIGAPKGIGLLYVRDGLQIEPLLYGGGQERGLRAGTENVAFIAALAQAFAITVKNREAVYPLMARLRERLGALEDVRVQSPADGSPFILNVGIGGIRGEILLHAMEQHEMYLSTGSACSGTARSRVLEQVGTPVRYATGSVRISMNVRSTMEEVETFCDALERDVAQIRDIIGR